MIKHTGLPPPASNAKGVSSYKFDEMEVGDCITFEGPIALKARGSAYSYAKRTGKVFTVRRTLDGCVVWRTK